jgi:MFS family permease
MEMAENTGAVKERIWTKAFLNIFIVSFVMSMGQFMMNTLVPKYAYQLGNTAAVAGTVAGMFAVSALVIRPFSGPAVDYFKKNRLMTIAIAMITLAFLFYGFSHSITMLIIARLIHGVGMGFVGPLSLALVSNTLPNSKMASGMGVFSLGSAIASAVGPTFGLKLASTVGYNNTFYICAMLMAVCLGLSFMIKGETLERPEKFRIKLNQIVAPEVLLPTLVLMLMMLAYSGINAFMAIYGGLCGVADIGLFFTASAVCLLIVRPLGGRIADRYGLDKTVIPGAIIFIGALTIISFGRTLPMFLLSGAVSAIGFGICQPILQTINMQLVPKQRRGAAGNTNFLGIDLGFLIGPNLAGAIIAAVQSSTGNEVQGISVMYRVMILPVIAAIVLFGLSRKKLRARMKALQEQQETVRTEPVACDLQENGA